MRGPAAVLMRFRAAALGCGIVLAALLAAAASKLEVRNDLAVWFVEGDPALTAYLAFRERYGSDEVVVLALENPGHRALEPSRLRTAANLARVLAADPDVERVAALPTAVTTDASGTLGNVVQGDVEADDVERARLALTRSALARQLVGVRGTDDDALLVWFWMKRDAGFDARRGQAYSRVRETVARAVEGSGERVSWAGGGLIYDELNRATEREGAAFIGLAYLIVYGALVIATRRFIWTLAAMAVVTLADMSLFGVIALSGTPLNAVTVALPTLVMVLAVADILHLALALERLEGTARQDLAQIAQTIADVARPALFNNLTTLVGFLSLSVATTSITRQVGVFSAVGVAFAFVFSFVVVSALAPRALRRPRKSSSLEKREELLGRITFAGVSPWRVVAPITLMTIILGISGLRVDVDTDTLGFLPEHNELRRSFGHVEDVAGPIIPVELEVTPRNGNWRELAFLGALESAQRALAAAPKPRISTSVHNLVADTHAALRALPASVLPETQEGVDGALAFLEVAAPDATDAWVHPQTGAARLTVRIPVGTARHLVEEAERARAIAAAAVGHSGTVAVTGYLPLYGRIVNTLVDDQIASFLVAFLLIFLAIGFYFRDLRFVLLAAAPNLVPIAVVFGAMAALSIRLDVATMTVASTILGIVVDDTVHTLHRLQHALRAKLSLDDALREALRHAGVANLSSNLVLIAGFLVLAAAPVKTVSAVGVLSAIAIASALVTDVILLPPLARIVFSNKMRRTA